MEPEFAALFLCFFALGCIMQAWRDIKRSEREIRLAITKIGLLIIAEKERLMKNADT